MTGQHGYLLIGSLEGAWQDVLRAAVTDDRVETIEPAALTTQTAGEHPLLYIIDNTYVEDVPDVIRKIRKMDAGARVLVVTGSPTWTRARDALKAGAIDYVKKTMDVAELRSIMKLALMKMLP